MCHLGFQVVKTMANVSAYTVQKTKLRNFFKCWDFLVYVDSAKYFLHKTKEIGNLELCT